MAFCCGRIELTWDQASYGATLDTNQGRPAMRIDDTTILRFNLTLRTVDKVGFGAGH